MSDLRTRIDAIKAAASFETAFATVAADCGVEMPRSIPGWILCPIHGEKTPSLHVEREFWYCHGSCKVGGDAFNFLMELEGVTFPEAVERVEALLGLSADRALSAAARARAAPRTEREEGAWVRAVHLIELDLLRAARPLLLAYDPLIRGLVDGPLDLAFDGLRDASSSGPPRVSRARRERLRILRAWAFGIFRGAAREVERVLGRDLLDLALLLSVDADEVRTRNARLVPLRDAAREVQRREKRKAKRP